MNAADLLTLERLRRATEEVRIATALNQSMARQYQDEGAWRWDGVYLHLRSGSDPSREYAMVQTPAGRWEHANPFACIGWSIRGYCKHEKEARTVAEMATEIEVYRSPLALIEQASVDAVIRDFKAVGEWRYSFRQKGQPIEGLSADGVQDGVRAMAHKGEAIRTLEVRLDHDNEREAFFVARAGRYAISPDGMEVLLDTTFRGKRVGKYEKRADGSGEYYNEDWWEHGVTKACRNAEEALMPEALKQWMIAQARAVTPGTPPRQNVSAPPRPSPPSQGRTQAPQRPARQPEGADGQSAAVEYPTSTASQSGANPGSTPGSGKEATQETPTTARSGPVTTATPGASSPASSPPRVAMSTGCDHPNPEWTETGEFVCKACGVLLDPPGR